MGKLKEKDKRNNGRSLPGSVTNIITGKSHVGKYNMRKSTIDTDKNVNNILRPNVYFMSNAKPAALGWREKEIVKTKISRFKPMRIRSRSRVPVHLGYSRKFIDYPEPQTLFSRKSQMVPSSSLIWLMSEGLNGLPQSIIHWKFPFKYKNVILDE